MPDHRDADLALRGDVEALFAIADGDATKKHDRHAYKWLCVAFDVGHAQAEARIDDVLETTSMRYDDSGLEAAAAHWELGVAYLLGEDGLSCDLVHAQRHLERAFEHTDLASINEGTGEHYAAEPVLARASEVARRVLQVELAGGDPRRRVEKAIERVLHLVACQAPTIFIDAERRSLREMADAAVDTMTDELRQRVDSALRAVWSAK